MGQSYRNCSKRDPIRSTTAQLRAQHHATHARTIKHLFDSIYTQRLLTSAHGHASSFKRIPGKAGSPHLQPPSLCQGNAEHG